MLNYDEKISVLDNIAFTVIAKSGIHGRGLFSTTTIPKNTILGILDGQVVNWDRYDQVLAQLRKEIENIEENLLMEWNALDEETLLVRPLRTKYSYINHSRTPNLIIMKNPLRIVARDDIKENEELFLDYREEPLRRAYLDGHGQTYL
ncbi:MAG TPA: SET domain-containing protein [Epulopiscium sp.]|nr:SET domain-containing protein [Candidatus Epulonipiscium sp.]